MAYELGLGLTNESLYINYRHFSFRKSSQKIIKTKIKEGSKGGKHGEAQSSEIKLPPLISGTHAPELING